jgi:hypothetical protein
MGALWQHGASGDIRLLLTQALELLDELVVPGSANLDVRNKAEVSALMAWIEHTV